MTEENKYCNEKVADKVVYELNMFTFLCGPLQSAFQESATFIPGDITYLGTGLSDDETDQETFALLESFLLHTRVLSEFFYSQKRDGDNVMAGDFVPNWATKCPAEPTYLVDAKQRLNKALAHLSLGRLKYDSDEKKWHVGAIRDAIEDAKKRFLDNLPTGRKPWFKRAKTSKVDASI